MSTESPNLVSPPASSQPPASPPPDDDSEALFGISIASGAIGLFLLMLAGFIYLAVSWADMGTTFPAFFDKKQWILAVGTGLFVLGVGLQANRLWDFVYRRRSLFALNVVLMSALAIALTCLIDYVTTVHFKEFDWTRQGVFTISDESVQVAKSIDKDIRIWVIFPEGGDSELVRRLVDHYRAKNARIDVQTLDPLLDREKLMDAIKELGLEARTLDDVAGVIVQAGYWEKSATGAPAWHTDKSKRLLPTDFFESGFDPASGQRGQKKFRGEQAMTNALIEVTEEKKPKLYFLTGHGELDMEGRGRGDYGQAGNLTKELRGKNYEVAALNIIDRQQKDIPEDASAVVIAGPTKPFDAQEVAALDKYLREGGRLFALLGPTTKENDTATQWVSLGIEPVLKKYGIELANEQIFSLKIMRFMDPDTGQTSEAPRLVPGCIANQFDASSKITQPLAGLRIAFNDPRVVHASSDNPHAKATEIVKTSAQAPFYAIADPASVKEIPSERKALPVMVASEEKLEAKPGDKKEKVTRLVVVGDAIFASNYGLDQGINEPIVLNSVNWLLGQERFTKEPVREGDYHLDMSSELRILYKLFACPGIPFLTILIGVTVWIIRRR